MTTNNSQSTTDVPPLPWQEVCESQDWWINTADEAAFDSGWVCDSNPGVFRNQETLDFMLKVVNAYPGLVAALQTAKLQIEYLHSKFQATGSGNQALAQINAALVEVNHD